VIRTLFIVVLIFYEFDDSGAVLFMGFYESSTLKVVTYWFLAEIVEKSGAKVRVLRKRCLMGASQNNFSFLRTHP